MVIRIASPATRPACIIVPVYRTGLSPSERASLERCVAVLGTHPIILAAPNTIDIGPLQRQYPGLACERFPADFFGSVRDYNRLLLSDEFYARFTDYEYLLVHQLDAFVFSDQLLAWCSRGYDYVGAPWIPNDTVPGTLGLLKAAIRRRYFRLTRRQYRNGSGDHHGQQHYAAGNGGFSLRRAAALRAVLKLMPERVEPYRLGTREPWAEDVFFSVEANRYRRHLRIPGFRESLQFSWERYPGVAARYCATSLPFGCHAWDRFHHDDWRPLFAGVGYSIDDLCAT
jgi:hypothetical protein